MQWPKISDDVATQRLYEESRAGGNSHNIAEIVATQQSPGMVGTDNAWWSGRWNEVERDPVLQEYARHAEASGVSTSGKVYISQLADDAGDPTAWVSDQGDAMAVAKRKGIGVQIGMKKQSLPSYDPGPPQPYRVADDLVAERAVDYCEENAGCTFGEAKKLMRKKMSPAAEVTP